MKRTIVRRGQLCDVLWGMLEGPNIGATRRPWGERLANAGVVLVGVAGVAKRCTF